MTIYDIAKEAGVSITTVSRVINQKPGIKASTREKVQQVLDKYNYLPNPTAKGLADRNSRMIALVTADNRELHYAHTVYTVERELSRRGYNCLLINTGEEQEERIASLETVMQKQVEGVILIGSTFQKKYIQKAIIRFLPDTPVVMANGYLPLSNVCGILCDGRKGMEMAVDYLTKLGHEKIAFVGDNDNASAQEKKQGYLDGMQKNGLEKWIRVQKSRKEVEDGEESTKQLLETDPHITAVIYEEDIIGIGGIHAITEKGFKVPEDVSVIGFDNLEFARAAIPKLTSIDDKLDVMGIKCAQTICDMLEGTATAAQMVLIPELEIRGSTQKRKNIG